MLLAGCTAEDPKPLPTAPSSTHLPPQSGRLRIQYFGDDGFSGLVFVDVGGEVLGEDQGRSDHVHPPARGLRLPHRGGGKDHGQGPSLAAVGDGTSVPTLGNDVGAVAVLDPRVVAVADTVNQLVADIALPAASRQVCT